MFLHLGGDVIVPKKDVIAIIDLKNYHKSKITEEFLQVADEEGFVKSVAGKGKEKSFVVTTKYVYYSPISSSTLKERAEELISNNEDELELD
jgi:ribosomal protein S8